MPSVAVKGQREPTMMMRLARKPSDDAIRAIIRECASDQVDAFGRPRPPAWEKTLFERAKGEWPEMRFHLPQAFAHSVTQFSILFYAPLTTQLSTGRHVPLPPSMQGSQEWGLVTANAAQVRHSEQSDMSWFLGKARQVLDILQPDFAFADVDTTLYKYLTPEPWACAWPLMVFGPERVKQLGRDTLLDAPAWKVEELSYGGIWVQVWENPFDAPQKHVTAVAKYLRVEGRGS